MKPDQVSVRDLSEADIVSVLDYWFRSPPGFIEAMGVDPAKMSSESEMEKSLREKLKANASLPSSKLNALVIEVDGEAVGFHTITSLTEGESGIFHAHIWRPEMRRKGIGMHSYPKACRVFMERFNLKKIVFKTPVQNLGAIRVKEKLGIQCMGEETIGFAVIKSGTLAKVFELTKSELSRLS